MGMDVTSVDVRTDHHFIVRKVLSREFLGNFQCQFWRNLPRLE